MPPEDSSASFPRHFEITYTVSETLPIYGARSRRHAALAGSGSTWIRLGVIALLVAALSLPAQGLGSVTSAGVPLVAMLLGLAFIVGVCAAWMEVGSMQKRAVRAFEASGARSFGPWQIDITDNALEGTSRGWSFGLEFSAVSQVIVDDRFVTLVADPTLDFTIPRRCLGDDRAAEAFRRFVEAQQRSRLPPG